MTTDSRRDRLRELNSKINRFAEARHAIWSALSENGPSNILVAQRDRIDTALKFLYEEKRALLTALGDNRVSATRKNPSTFALWKAA